MRFRNPSESALTARVPDRLKLASDEAAQTGRPIVPAACYPARGFDLRVTRDGIQQLDSEDSAGFVVASYGRRSALGVVVDTIGRRTPDGTLLNVVVVRVTTPGAAMVALQRAGITIDRAPIVDTWAVVFDATAGLSPLSEVHVAASIKVADLVGRQLVTASLPVTPLPAPTADRT